MEVIHLFDFLNQTVFPFKKDDKQGHSFQIILREYSVLKRNELEACTLILFVHNLIGSRIICTLLSYYKSLARIKNFRKNVLKLIVEVEISVFIQLYISLEHAILVLMVVITCYWDELLV